ncbi:MAG: hypothetical protein ABS52_15620 [Gemmatimonadetes bacterium SCN 70-22]|nr:MAG: hypothetical protein ABS52_15620 [Gemmatimonadetes bacterium SCN 70-22]
MASPKRLTDLIDYTAVLPYDSELFGIYQPLLGWKSKRIASRLDAGYDNDRRSLLERFGRQFSGLIDVTYGERCEVKIKVQPGAATAVGLRTFDSVLLAKLATKFPAGERLKPALWQKLLSAEELERTFAQEVTPVYTELYQQLCKGEATGRFETLARSRALEPDRARATLESRLRYESSMAGALQYLAAQKAFGTLADVFFTTRDNAAKAASLLQALGAANPIEGALGLDTLNPRDREHLQRVALSPISVVHLFRQYFFELDSFLGTPVGHVWMSPGSTVELVEVQTRRVVVEKTLEQALETTFRNETQTSTQEEISEAVKQDNKDDIKFGASVSASYASVTATSSFDYSRSQQQAREESHKRMRQQTEKLSSEIRKSFKSTFKTISETTDTSSKRYVLTNTTDALINYELRRKMRQVAVQVQDVGSYLCWQTYVDRPGEQLGLAQLMHIAKPADLDGIPAPEEIPMLQPFAEQKVVTIPFISIEGTDADNEGEVYKDGVEVDDSEWFGNLEKIQSDFPMEAVCPRSGYVLENVEFDGQGKPVQASRKGGIDNGDNRAKFTLHLDSADFQGQNSVQVGLTLHWSPAPGANDDVVARNKANLDAFKAREAAEFQKAFLETAKERIKLTHEIAQRPSDELREEERIVVYRKLIQEMLTAGVPMPDDRTRHVVAELINSIFDVDKMLYFVAPEWWRPRFYDAKQQLEPRSPARELVRRLDAGVRSLLQGLANAASSGNAAALAATKVGWGGMDDPNRDNYWITADSQPARFGSSLGWLLQLDGDNMRNAFLNAPWVKAVIPIRPGKEEAAINWLQGVEGFNGIGPADIYQTDNPNEKDIDGNPLNGQPMLDVIMDLARKIRRKHQEGVETGKYPKEDEIADPQLVDEANVVTSTPIDRVYEHGFYPLEGGFRANVGGNYEIFDQWLEILPTDQVVPVEVKYDPKTGRQV